ncbi:MAG: hypothetical protein K8R63_03230 [Bacteroidales bacterium]|nr:hypothetical protein [Bacteroidales bacterium]
MEKFGETEKKPVDYFLPGVTSSLFIFPSSLPLGRISRFGPVNGLFLDKHLSRTI